MPTSKLTARPNFFIVGSMKSGTSTLYEYLVEHPDIFMSEVKEPSYFVDRKTLEWAWPDMARMGFWRGEEFYLQLFEGAQGHKAIGEASTNYSKLPRISNVADRIAEFNPEARIIFIMRDPVLRTISHYWHFVRTGRERRTIDKAIREDSHFREVSHYSMQLAPYISLFGREQVLPLIFEDLRDNPLEVVQRVFAWLGVDPGYVPETIGQSFNVKPEEVLQVRGVGMLHRIRYSKAWSLVGSAVPPSVRAFGRRLERRPVDPKSVSTDKVIEYLGPMQRDQTLELSELTGLDFDKWETLKRF